MQYVYVMSHAFSGSTLLALLMGSHPRIATAGEITVAHGFDVDSYVCSCGRVIRECTFWTGIRQRMESAGLEYDISDPRLRFRSESWLADRVLRAGVRGSFLEAVRSLGLGLFPGARREFRTLLHRSETFARAVTEQLDRPVFLDISKHPNRLHLLRRSPRLDIHVIYLVRDARAVTQSCRKNLGFTTEEGARSWNEFAVEAERMRRQFDPKRWFRLRYEDLCREPDRSMDRLFEFLDLPPDTGYLEFQSCEHHIIGNRMRLGSSSEIRLDEKWKTALDDEDLRVVARIAGERNTAYGNDGSP